MPIADCRLPIADCRLPIADCRLPIADCRLRLPILRQRRLRSSWSGWFVLSFPRIMPTSTTKANIKFFCNFLFPIPPLQGAGIRKSGAAATKQFGKVPAPPLRQSAIGIGNRQSAIGIGNRQSAIGNTPPVPDFFAPPCSHPVVKTQPPKLPIPSFPHKRAGIKRAILSQSSTAKNKWNCFPLWIMHFRKKRKIH